MRLIDADAFAEHINIPDEEITAAVIFGISNPKKWEHAFESVKAARDGFLMDIKDAPTIDAVPVVRCKDCAYSRMYCFGASDTPTLACCEVEDDGFIRFATVTGENDFCCRGVRKVDEVQK